MASKRKAGRPASGRGAEGGSMWQSASGLPVEMLPAPRTPSPSQQSKRRPAPTAGVPMETESASSSPLTLQEPTQPNTFSFKHNNFVHSSRGAASGRRQRVWRSLKQVLSSEKSTDTQHTSYSTIEAPPSFKPAKKYSDLSGLPAKYTDPHTKLRYATSDEFARLRVLPSDIVAGYLTLRKANTVVP